MTRQLQPGLGAVLMLALMTAACSSGSSSSGGSSAQTNTGGGTTPPPPPTPGVDLAVTRFDFSPVTLPPSVGDQFFNTITNPFVLVYSIRNQGTDATTDDLIVSLHSSPNATVTTQDRMFDFLKVAAGFTANTVTDQFGVTFLGLRAAPAALTSGPASIALIADSTDQQVEAIESNNSVLAANSPLDFQAVTGGPDVCPAGFISTSNALSVSINQPFTLSLDVTNVGDASGAGPSVVILEDGAGREVVVGSDAQTTYAAGGLITLTIQCTLPATIPTTAGPVATTAGDGFLTIALGLSPTTFQPQISGEVSTDNNFQLERITVN